MNVPTSTANRTPTILVKIVMNAPWSGEICIPLALAEAARDLDQRPLHLVRRRAVRDGVLVQLSGDED